MDLFNIFSVLITLAALFAYLNHRFIKLPDTIGLMFITLIMSLGLLILGKLGIGTDNQFPALIARIDFNRTLMVGMLGFMLFAGALHVNINELSEKKLEVGIFATFGVIISTISIGTLTYLVVGVLGINLKYIYCLLFGSIISPTDPIAVLGILKKAGAPKTLEIKIAGESLFNDGIGVVVFIALLGIATGEHNMTYGEVSLFFLKEAIGGAVFGIMAGWAVYLLLKSVDNYQVEILLTLALVTGGYALALAMHISGPITIVVAGLLIGNHGRRFAMSEKTRENIDKFWELLDEILNAVLFVLIGLELLMVTFSTSYLLAGIIAIPVALFSRFTSIGIPVCLLRFRKRFSPGVLRVMTWGGLRGGISIALALSLPKGYEREIILTMTYMVVVFSILVQGLTVKYLIKA
ncbi:MAG: sodium:proton antiporter [Nitrospirota bacterium]|nr:sodium:proton antiporter [Nitrospirota bacterium]